jgi:hypothetical protein
MKEERLKEFNIVKKIIKENIKDADSGLYDNRNWVGDRMSTLFKGKYFMLDICYYYSYYEIFGTTKIEFNKLHDYYKKCGGR